MALLTALSLDAARSLAATFGVAVRELEPLTLGSVNSNFRIVAADGSAFFARFYEEQSRAGAENEVRLLSALAGAGVPVVAPLATRDGTFVVEHDGKPFAIFPWIDGEWLCLQRVTAEHCRALGAALARVHLASSRVTRLSDGRFRPEDMLARLERVEGEAGPRLAGSIAEIRDLYARYRPQRDSAIAHGICHGDLFRDNVLWRDGQIAALLDFESVAWGSFAYDLMVTALAWCYPSALCVEHARALFAGYVAVRPLSAEEWRALPVEGALGCLRFATTRITDFELRTPPGARPARDFRRFLGRLRAIEAGAFEPVFAAVLADAR